MFAKVLLVVAFLLAELVHRQVYGFTPKLRFSKRPGISIASAYTRSEREVARTTKLIRDPYSFQLSSSSHVDGSKTSTGKLGQPIRSRLRQLTGFSLTAFRATMRTATGISMTAVYASTLAFSGQWMRQTMKFILSIFPAWSRYFVQPLLILYYLPLFTLRNLTGPNRRRGLDKPQALVDGWNEAVVTADSETSVFLQNADDENL